MGAGTPAPGETCHMTAHMNHDLTAYDMFDTVTRDTRPSRKHYNARLVVLSTYCFINTGRYRAFEIGVLKFAGDFSLRFQFVK